MERITDFFKDVRDRLSNPLFSSFIISWLIINWQVPVGLIFYNNQTLKIDGYNSYMDLIVKKYSPSNYFYYPFLFALLYTFVFPFFRNVILAFHAWIKTWGIKWNLKISETGKVSMNRYIQLRSNYHEQTKLLENLYQDESKFKQENDVLKTEKIKLNTEKNAINSDLELWKLNNNYAILDGEWDVNAVNPLDSKEYTSRIRIRNGTMLIFTPANNQKGDAFSFNDFFYNPITNRVCFALTNAGNIDVIIVQLLNSKNSLTELEGIQITTVKDQEVFGKSTPIKYKKTS